MGQPLFTNNAFTTLSAGCTNSATSLVVTSSSTFPSVTTASGNWFYACLQDTFANLEIVKVTNVTGTTWTVTRAVGGTAARAFPSGTVVELRVTAETLSDIYAYTVSGSLQNSTSQGLLSVGGVNSITATASPTLTAYAFPQTFRFVSVGANTTAVTLNIDGLGPVAVTKQGNTALAPGDIPGAGVVVQVTHDGTQFQMTSVAGTLVSKAAANTFTATQTPSNNTAAVSTTSSYVFDGANQVREITFTNAITVTFGAPTGITENAMYVFKLKAGDTSARTFAWNAAYKFPTATPPLTSGSTTTGGKDIISFIGGPSNTLEYLGHQADER
jgi:hypothetical protein